MTRRRNYLQIFCILAATSMIFGALGTGDVGLTQGQRKIKLEPSSVFHVPTPYSLAIMAQGKRIIHVAGQTPLDAKGTLVGKDNPEAQARQAFANMKAVLEAGGANMDDVVKLTIIVKNVADVPKIGAVRREFFKEPYPAGTVFVAGLVNPDWLLEVEAVAIID
jgi:2-iminobutanoate/2-iminopropanoate deaminase